MCSGEQSLPWFFTSVTCPELTEEEVKKILGNMPVFLSNYQRSENYAFKESPNSQFPDI